MAPNRLNRYGKWSGALSENIIYGNYSPKRALIAFLIDDGNSNRSQRLNLFNPKYNVIGASCGEHKSYKKMWAVAFCSSYKSNNAPGGGSVPAHSSGPISSSKAATPQQQQGAPSPASKSAAPAPANNEEEEEPAKASLEESKDGKEFILRTVDLEVTNKDDLKVFKKRGEIHIIKTKKEEDSEVSSDFRYSFPFEFNASSVIAEFDSKTGKVLLRIVKQSAAKPGVDVVVGEYDLQKGNGEGFEEKVTFDLDEETDYYKLILRGSKKYPEHVKVILKEEGYKILVESSHDEEEYDAAENEDVIKTITRREGIRLPISIGDGRPVRVLKHGTSDMEISIGKLITKSTDDPEQDIPIHLN